MSERNEVSKTAEQQPARNGASLMPPVDVVEDASGITLFADLPGDANVSFEFFPPKSEKMEAQLWEAIEKLAPLNPSFVSVTYGAGGSTRERTHATIARILAETKLTPAAHLTCVAASKADIDDVVARYHDVGVRHIVALRGDPTSGIGTQYTAHPDGYQQSSDLVAAIKRNHPDMEVSVSAYPEKHPESASLDADIDARQG